ncbi:sulfite exporter TauE/SafE family protein [Xenorhabdus sp. DI]|uniref:sulfite exporter TauE/SafE family protein n=1 Tax=Xenorhabdus doucetiae TaxID=351671 RepID=UPI0019937F14|nr:MULTISPECIES: sulfite exporter TauE/SafE family protein [unclassified Xenorhabdus]MBD2784975.1 sulfite exporter TauE/SafE family protein [Xenorhabdus sp. 3]MBD2787136.1 sulfite exporter TauE/SafE family protein [Xenorhabdus sp. DI]MBD2796574.1 sulfite exporter TauE/SafE family protein [Xenorhabdus sp. 18]
MFIEMEIEVLIVISAFIGSILSGLFGGGAGLIFTPTIYLFLSHTHPNSSHIMQTSITTMIASLMVSGLAAIVKHHRYNYIDWKVLKWSAPLIITGSILGCFVMTHISSQSVIYVFSLATLILAVRSTRKLIFHPPQNNIGSYHGWLFRYFGSFILGLISTLSGAASFVVPYYECIGLNIKKAIGTTTAVVWLYSIFVLIFMISLGLNQDNLPPGNIGFLNYKYLWLFMIPTIPGALLGAKLANILPERKLKILFTILLYFIGSSMLVS